MALRPGRNLDRKINRKDRSRREDRQPDFFDLGGDSKETGSGTYGERGTAGYGRGGREDYSDFLEDSSEDRRPYREKHRVEVDIRSSGDGENRPGDYYRQESGYQDFYSKEKSREIQSDWNLTQRPAGRQPGSYAPRSGSDGSFRTGQAYGRDPQGRPGSRIVRGNNPGSRRNKPAGAYRPGSSDYSYPGYRNSGRDLSTGETDYRGAGYRESGFRGSGYKESGYRGIGSDPGERRNQYPFENGGKSSGYSENGNASSGRTDTEAGKTSKDQNREISADLFVYSGTPAGARRRGITRVSGSSLKGREGSSEAGRNRRGRGGRFEEAEKQKAWSREDDRTRDQDRAGRSYYGEERDFSSPYSSCDPYSSDEINRDYKGKDYFHEEDLDEDGSSLYLPSEDGSGVENASERSRQRARRRREREQQLRKMYFRMGAAAGVAVLILVLGITAAVIHFRGRDNNPIDSELQESGTLLSDEGKDADSSPVDAEGAGSPPGGAMGIEGKDNSSQGGEDAEDTSRTGNSEAGYSTQDESAQEDSTRDDAAREGTPGNTDTQDTFAGKEENSSETLKQDDSETGDNAPGDSSGQQVNEEDQTGTGPGTEELDTSSESQDGDSGMENPDADMDSGDDPWFLVLINADNIPEEIPEVEVSYLPNGEAVDSRCFSQLDQMLKDCQKQSGGTPIVCSSYRSHAKQEKLFKDQIDKLMKDGMTRAQAQVEAAKEVAIPGSSEHELGLAVDICDSEYQLLNDKQAETKSQIWLMDNSWKYGFILRYPTEKSDITGIIFEPWHYRYVGSSAAKEIYENGWCLEEYLDHR